MLVNSVSDWWARLDIGELDRALSSFDTEGAQTDPALLACARDLILLGFGRLAADQFRPHYLAWENLLGCPSPCGPVRRLTPLAAARFVCLADFEIRAPRRADQTKLRDRCQRATDELKWLKRAARNPDNSPEEKTQLVALAASRAAHSRAMKAELETLPKLSRGQPPMDANRDLVQQVELIYFAATGAVPTFQPAGGVWGGRYADFVEAVNRETRRFANVFSLLPQTAGRQPIAGRLARNARTNAKNEYYSRRSD